MATVRLVSSTEGTKKIKIRCFFFTEEKLNFVRKRAKERELFTPQIGHGGLEWPYVYVRGNEENIKNFFNDLKDYFLLPPFYEK